MKKIKTYERIQGRVHFIAGILKKINKQGKTYYQVYCKHTVLKQKVEYTDMRPIYDRQKALENSKALLEQISFDYNKKD